MYCTIALSSGFHQRARDRAVCFCYSVTTAALQRNLSRVLFRPINIFRVYLSAKTPHCQLEAFRIDSNVLIQSNYFCSAATVGVDHVCMYVVMYVRASPASCTTSAAWGSVSFVTSIIISLSPCFFSLRLPDRIHLTTTHTPCQRRSSGAGGATSPRTK